MKTEIVRVKDSLWGQLPENVTLTSPYKNTNIVTRVLRKAFAKYPFIQGVINNPKLKNSNADVLLVFDSVSAEFLKWLKKHNPGKRMIFWYWNPVHLSINPLEVPSGYEKWSYSINDCEKYNLKYNTQFCFPKYVPDENQSIDYDVFFFGRNKGRAAALESYKHQFEKAGLATYFRIIENDRDYLPYEEVIRLTQKARCILDFCVNDTVGISLRALEALFLNKKVITNNKMYVREKFYKPENVFILGVDDISRIKEFVTLPVKSVEQCVKDEYLFENWIKRF